MAKNLFNSIQVKRPKGNMFDLSHDVKLSMNMGELVPVMVQECIPGDKFRVSCESMVRLAPLVSPMMHRVDQTIHYFFVPTRILWPNWEKFISNTKLDDPEALPAFPTVTIDENNETRLSDYLGVPPCPVGAPSEVISAIPFAAYQMIWNEYYRDQNLQSEVAFELTDGDNTAGFATSLGVLRRRAWEHDYFTSALPFAQKGDAVQIPVTQNFDDVAVMKQADNPPTGDTIGQFETTDAPVTNAPVDAFIGIGNAQNPVSFPVNQMYAKTSDLNPSEPTTINDLRRAFRLQEWLELAARAGTRLKEVIWGFFGVDSGDARLQRPEYITGVKTPIQISEVLNTTGTEDLPQGNMAGHGVSVSNGYSGSYFVREHGFIIGVMSVMPKTAYQQGLQKHWLKTNSPFEYFWPQFANIGEQEVLYKEIFAFNAEGGDTFGYVPRYAEYKFNFNRVAGDFRTSLDFWHMGRIFSSLPGLNNEFVECDPTHRVFAVTDAEVQKLYVHIYNKVHAWRLMPKYGTPTF